MYQKLPVLYKWLIISNYMDFLRFYFPFFCIHWLMGDYLLSANPAWYADHFRPDTVGFQPASEMGRCVGEVADKVSDSAFLWGNALLRGILCIAAL